MEDRPNQDRYGYTHRSDSSHSIGDSMPGTIGDSEGTLHDRLGEVPTVERENITEPGQQEREDAKEVGTEDRDVEKMMAHL